MKKRKYLAVITAAMMFISTLSGCGNGGTATAPAPEDSAEEDAGGQEESGE